MIKKFIGTLIICCCAFVAAGATAEEALFNRTTAKLDKGGMYYYYQNTAKLPEQIKSLLEIVAKAAPKDDPVQQMAVTNFIAFLQKVDFSELQAFGASGRKVGKDLYASKVYLAVDPKADGLLFSAFKKENLPLFNIGSTLPADTVFASVFYIDGQNSFAKLEKQFAGSPDFQSLNMMFQQMSGVPAKTFAENCTGEYFAGVFKGAAPEKFDFFVVVPDRMDVLKNWVKIFMANNIKTRKDGALIYEVPFPENTPFGKSCKFIFNKNTVTICSNENVLNKPDSGKLVDVNSRIFGFLKNIQGTGFVVLNVDPADIDADIPSRKYQLGSALYAEKSGFYNEEFANFDVCDWSEYDFISEFLDELSEEEEPVSPVQTAE